MGSSVGVVKAHDPSEFPAAMRELVALIAASSSRKRSTPASWRSRCSATTSPSPRLSARSFRNEFYDYNAKYVDDNSELLVPAPIDRGTMAEIQEMAIAAFRALDLAGMARIDFFMDRNTDQIYINEVNTIPGFTAISMFPRLWQGSGMPLEELVDRLIGLALERSLERRRTTE